MGHNPMYDIAVIGAGPAGSTAAALLARAGRQVLLLDGAHDPHEGRTTGWVNALAVPLLTKIGFPVKKTLKQSIADVRFFSADLSKTAVPAMTDAPGFLVDSSGFRTSLVDTAVRSGAEFRAACPVARIRPAETNVQFETTQGDTFSARLLLFACGQGNPLFDQLGMLHPPHHDATWTGQVCVDSPNRPASGGPTVGIVFGLDGGNSFSLYTVSRDRISVSINWCGDRGDALLALTRVCAALATQGVLPVDLSAQAAKVALSASPASGALDMESHVAKHVLVIGDAGGFVAAVSNEGTYPAMWSAEIACEVADAALSGACSQDELMIFDTKWRIAMADYLRPPNTDIQFLLPLIFSNQPMADRMGNAFFSGENI